MGRKITKRVRRIRKKDSKERKFKLEEFAARMFELRIHWGITQKDFAECLDVGKRTVEYWESSENFPTHENFERICRMTEVDPAWLLGLKNARKAVTFKVA